MTLVQTKDGIVEVDRDYLPLPAEDVTLRLPEVFEEGVSIVLTMDADQADALADALKFHAAEVRDINRLADERDASA